MTPITVDFLLTQIVAAIYNQRLGYHAVNGTLTDWRRHRHGAGTASGELVTGTHPPPDSDSAATAAPTPSASDSTRSDTTPRGQTRSTLTAR